MITINDTNAYAKMSPVRPNSPGRRDAGRRERGAAVTELVVILSSLLTLSLGIVQGALIYNAKTTLNYATFEAARAGAVYNAQRSYMTEALARGLMPLYGGGTDTASLTTANVRAYTDLMLPAVPSMNLGSGSRLEILSPTQEAFQDFGVTVDGQQQIPNEHLRFKPRDIGSASGVNLQDANILKIKVTYGYKLYVPLVNRVIAAALTVTDPGNAAFYQADPPRLPIVAQATVRMQSNPYPDRNSSSGGNGGGGGGGGGGGSTPPGTTPPGQGGDPVPDDPGTGSGTGGPASGGGDSGGADPCADGSCGQGDPQVCASDDPAAQPTQTASVSVGNPINVVTGNKYQREVDLSLPGALAPEFTRHYNSQSKYRAPLGYGWTHTYSTKLNAVDETRIAIRQADGRNIVFRRQPSGIYEARLVTDGYITSHKSLRVWRWRNGRALTFDSDGKLLRIETPTGEALALTYDRNNRLVQVSDTQERRLAFRYYPNGRIESIVDPAGEAFRYTYDANGNLITATAPDNTTRAYHYEDRLDVHNLTGITDGRGVRYATYAYDEQDRAILSTHAGGVGRVTLAFKRDRTIVMNSKGVPSTYRTSSRDGIALVTAIEGPGCSQCGSGDIRYGYNERLQLTEILTRDGAVTRHQYDDLGRMTRTTRTAEGKTDLVARYEYLGDSLRPSLVARPSLAPGREHTVTLTYGVGGRLVARTERGFRPDGAGNHHPITRTHAFAYKGGRLVSIDGPLTGTADTVRYDHDATGRVVAIHGPARLTTRIEAFDTYGRPARVRDPNGVVTEYRYNVHGQAIEVKRAGVVHTVEYGPEGHPAKLVRPDGSFLVAAYDEAGRLARILDPEGNAVTYQRDTENNLLQVALSGATGETLLARQFRYDAENRLTAAANGDDVQFAYGYDPASRLSTVTDPIGRRTAYRYDAFGNLTALLHAAESKDPVVTKFDRDPRRHLTALTDAESRTTRFQYDDFGNKVVEISPDRGIRLYRYDAANRLLAKADESGIVSYYHYDAADRLIASGIGKRGPSVRFEYVGTLLKRRIDPNETVEYLYDAAARPVQEARTLLGTHYITRYRYDESTGKPIEKALPDGQVLAYRYDGKSGRLRSIARKIGGSETVIVDDIRHQPFGPANFYRLGNGLTVRYGYDTSGRLNDLHNGVQHIRLDYDDASRLTALDIDGARERFDFDRLDRLAVAAGKDGAFAWTYDKTGNRLTQTVNGSTERYSYAQTANRLTEAGSATPAVYRYDATGNPLTTRAWRYEYNAGHRSQGAYRGKQIVQYRYSANGARIEKRFYDAATRTSITTRYLYDGPRLIGEANAKGELTRQYLYLDERPLAILEGRAIYYIHTDYRHAPVAVTTPTKQILWAARYEPFGYAHVSEDIDRDGKPFALNLRLPGQYYDRETETHYNYQRDYDPKTGRYLTPDPLGIAAGVNPYSYVSNNPLQKIDLYGTYEIDVHYYVTFFLAVAAGLDQDLARTIALATQYIDDNPDTRPLDPINPAGNVNNAAAIRRLGYYHFTQRPGDDWTQDEATRFTNPTNGQLDNLYAAAGRAPNLCAFAQLYGEYLHAFQDTFAHRDQNNVPIAVNLGIGHGWYGHEPDRTYNHTVVIPDPIAAIGAIGNWDQNEARTLQMEREVFEKFLGFNTGLRDPSRAVTWEQIEPYLRSFNATQAHEPDPNDPDDPMRAQFNAKIEQLNVALTLLGYGQMGLAPGQVYGYNRDEAAANRDVYLRPLIPNAADYPGVILPSVQQ